jgi:hypothetical protein
VFQLVRRVIAFLQRFRVSRASKNFIEHNRRLFPVSRRMDWDAPLILMEMNSTRSAHIAYSYLANGVASQESAKIVGYAPSLSRGLKSRLVFKLSQIFGDELFRIYRSFGCDGFLQIRPNRVQVNEARRLLAEILPTLQTRSDIVDLTVDDIWIGDLVYDTFLKTQEIPIVEVGSPLFQNSLLESLEKYVFWRDFFKSRNVRGINVSHCVYDLAIPLRIAVQRNIPAYQANLTHVYRLGRERLFAYNDFFNFRERFNSLPEHVRAEGLSEAKTRIERRFSGEVGVDMAYSSKSAFGSFRHDRLIQESDRTKVLVAAHCFFDSPHSYGKNLFADFNDWLEFLGEASQVTDYDWYIKTHPDFIEGTRVRIEQFVKRFPKFTLLPSDSSHNQIVAEGIDIALTGYGTIGFEYAAMGKAVVNASLNNPHIMYNFNLHPKNIEEYREIIINLGGVSIDIDASEIYEYYFMKNIFNTENLFLENYAEVIRKIGGYGEQFKDEFYNTWLESCSMDRHRQLTAALAAFIGSNDFRMGYEHFPRRSDTSSGNDLSNVKHTPKAGASV